VMQRPGRTNKAAGFTLAEVIVASVILCAAVITLSAITTRCLGNTKLNREYELAWELLDRQLAVIDYMGVDEFIKQGIMEGDFENTAPGYRWEVETSQLDYDNLWQLDVTITWESRKREHKISAGTMLNSREVSAQAGPVLQ